MDAFLVFISVFDLMMSLFSTEISLSFLRVLRICRVIRMVRVFKVCSDLWFLVLSIIRSLQAIFWVGMLIVLLVYVSSIICVEMMGRKEMDGKILYPGHDDDPDDILDQYAKFNNYIYFGTMSRSMYTLFTLSLLAEFDTFSRPVWERQPIMIAFFILFVVFTAFGIFNILIGMIVDKANATQLEMDQEKKKQDTKKKLQELMRIREMVFSIDSDASGSISEAELELAFKMPAVVDLLEQVDLPQGWTPNELLALLDQSGDKTVDYDEFIKTFWRLLLNNPFQQTCCTQASLNDIKQKIVLRIEPRLTSLAEALSTLQQSQNTLEQKLVNSQEPLKTSMQKGFQDLRCLLKEKGLANEEKGMVNGEKELANEDLAVCRQLAVYTVDLVTERFDSLEAKIGDQRTRTNGHSSKNSVPAEIKGTNIIGPEGLSLEITCASVAPPPQSTFNCNATIVGSIMQLEQICMDLRQLNEVNVENPAEPGALVLDDSKPGNPQHDIHHHFLPVNQTIPGKTWARWNNPRNNNTALATSVGSTREAQEVTQQQEAPRSKDVALSMARSHNEFLARIDRVISASSTAAGHSDDNVVPHYQARARRRQDE
eukprot:gnl/MRDRNA2_/MRDRNA2_29762_c0_seq1.p1 gnl/MRDRNA2_/MRDRNA2_29762_c0~~gnl/MRDRNA2_/MRDRNA2_29762_c0_seq1.p1  ORF type:complete len:664 (+),score=132.33 gnl/MRDRNA2_/MRDRNA2_29762_c0_seq1:196-1992(+)